MCGHGQKIKYETSILSINVALLVRRSICLIREFLVSDYSTEIVGNHRLNLPSAKLATRSGERNHAGGCFSSRLRATLLAMQQPVSSLMDASAAAAAVAAGVVVPREREDHLSRAAAKRSDASRRRSSTGRPSFSPPLYAS